MRGSNRSARSGSRTSGRVFLRTSPGAQLTEQPDEGPERDEARRWGFLVYRVNLGGSHGAVRGLVWNTLVSLQTDRPVRACAREGSASSLAECKQEGGREGGRRRKLVNLWKVLKRESIAL